MSIAALIAARVRPGGRVPFVIGIAGAQGSGKSTGARELGVLLDAPVLSLDDLYLDGAARARLAASIHPLLRTRGVPGTHDVAPGLELIERIGREQVTLPRFDKTRDEPGAGEAAGPAKVLILEGWCLGARPQTRAELIEPVNALEREHDPDGIWRRWVNARLAEYQPLFARIDFLTFLAAPGFDVVADWRIEQERNAQGPMTAAGIRTFVQHYQRITEHMLRDTPARADLTVRLGAGRKVIGVED